MAKENGFGMSDEEIRKLVEREQSRKAKNLRQRVAQRLFMKKAKAAGITVSDAEIDAELQK